MSSSAPERLGTEEGGHAATDIQPPPGLTSGQHAERGRIAEIPQSNAQPGTHADDASHLESLTPPNCPQSNGDSRISTS